ncbi:MAG: response regulator transcription factor, partial [Clostridiales bacterium]|nr:response regulator transcription factor [Clostridiales bacterium]
MQKILVVEDDKAINGLVCTYLRENGYAPIACYDGDEALNALENESFSMIISDVMMPKMDGFALA